MARARAAALVAVGVFVAGPVAQAAVPAAARRAAGFIAGRQMPNGAFFSEDTPADAVADAVASLAAVGSAGDAIERALVYIERNGPERAREKGGYAGRIVMGLVAAGRDPRTFGGEDYAGILRSSYNPVLGTYDSTNLYADALAVLGVVAARETPPPRALDHLREGRCPGGGFSHQERCLGASADTDTTAIVVMALLAAGATASDDALAGARAYLIDAQGDDGGFGIHAGEKTNANSTGLVLSAIAAVGDDPSQRPWRQGDGDDPMRALLRLQLDSGGFRYTTGQERENDYATVQAIPGIAARAYPIRPAPPRAGARATVDAPAASAPPLAAAPHDADRRSGGADRPPSAIPPGGGPTTTAAPPAARPEPAASNAPAVATATALLLAAGALAAYRARAPIGRIVRRAR